MGDLFDALRPGPLLFEAFLDLISQAADEMFEWAGGHMAKPEGRRRSLGWDLDTLVRILGWAGLVERSGASVADKWDPTRERVVGGTLALTAAARWWMGD